MRLYTYLFFLLFFVVNPPAYAQKIYSKAYGSKNNPAIIYVHGGPRGNATLFEGTTAQALADKGFYVIAYDRRGEGRSFDTTASFTFRESFHDLNNLLDEYQLEKVTIIGHSFGGIVATLYTESNPERVERLILLGALFTQQETYNHILTTVDKLATIKKDTATVHKIASIKRLDKNSADYRKQTYEIAAAYGYFRMPHPTDESKAVNKQYEESRFSKQNIRNDQAPVTFYKNESRVNIDTKPVLRNIKKAGVPLYAVYGRQDGIFAARQIQDIKKLVTPGRFYAIDNCSHYPFVDQQTEFLRIIETIMQEAKR